MKEKIKEIKDIITPNKRINIFILSTIILGVISGSIFSVLINNNDKKEVINSVQAFMNNITNINNLEVFRNSLFINLIFIILMFILGMSVIGVLLNIFLVYIKNFILGFSISSFFITYGFKGILGAFIYIFPHQLINILIFYLLGIYSVLFSLKLISRIFNNRKLNLRQYFKRYILITLITLILALISSLIESFILPILMKLIIKVFI